MQTPKKILLLSDYHKESTRMNYYPITCRNFPICADYYNPLSLVMDNLHYLLLRLVAWDEKDIRNRDFIKYNIHDIYKTGLIGSDGKEEEIAVVVSAIPRKIYEQVRNATYGVNYDSEAELKLFCRNLSFMVSNTIYVNRYSDMNYIYKADVFHRDGIVKVIKSIYHKRLHEMKTLDAYVLTLHACMYMDNTNYLVDDEIVKTTKPEHFQLFKELLRKQTNKFNPILLPHIDHKNDLLRYLKNKYLLDKTMVQYMDDHHLYYRQDMAKEFDLPAKVAEEIEYTLSVLLAYMRRRNITFSSLDMQMSRYKESSWYLSQYPLSNLLRFVDTGSIKADEPFLFIRDSMHLEEKVRPQDIYSHYPPVPFGNENKNTETTNTRIPNNSNL